MILALKNRLDDFVDSETVVGFIDNESDLDVEKEVLPKGEIRYIHVNPLIIAHNLNKKAKVPAVIIRNENGKRIGQYHGVMVNGSVAIRQVMDDKSVQSPPKTMGLTSIYLVTKGEIATYWDRRFPIVNVKFPNWKDKMVNFGKSLYKGVQCIPILGCVLLSGD